jgi:C1A family cysteine protease
MSVDLRTSGLLPDVWDQGALGACSAHGSGAAYSYELARQHGTKNYLPSRLFIYYNERAANGTIREDSGATITDAIRSLNQHGAPPEQDWPYDISKFTHRPPIAAYRDGETREALQYARVHQTADGLRQALAAGFPVVVGFTVFESFESEAVAATGVVPMPNPNEQVCGGHCVLVTGYSPDGWIVRNSWGTSWGQGGYFTLPLEYLLNPSLASDFWTVEMVGAPKRSVWARLLRWLG